MSHPLSTPAVPPELSSDRTDCYASHPDAQTRRLAMVERLSEIGMGLAEALLRQVNEPGAPVMANDVALAYSRIARGVRLTIVLAQRIEAEPAPRTSFWDVGVATARCAAALSAPTGVAAACDPRSAPLDESGQPEVEPRETGHEGGAERLLAALDARLDHEADEAAWLTRPLADLAAQICQDLGVPFDAALWEDQNLEGLEPLPDGGWGKGRIGGVRTEPGREALVGADAIRVSTSQHPASTPIPTLPPSVIGKDTIMAAIRKHQPP